MSFSDWSNTKKKKNTGSFSDWSNSKYGITEDDDDIAPVKGGNKDSVFKSGGFSDGVDGVGDFFADLGQTVLGSVGDLGLNIVKGAGRLVEGVTDLATYGVAGAADLFGADDFADKAKNFAKKSQTDALTQGAEDYLDQYSVFGDKADMVGEGLGQVAGIILTGGAGGAAGLSAAGVSALTTGTMFASGMGSGMSEAYSSGASDGEAFGYGVMTGGVEAVSEMIFGGLGKGVKALGLSKGLTSIDDVFAKKLSTTAAKFITSEAGQRVVGNALEFSVKSGAEGLEEVISGLGSALAKDIFLLNGEDEKRYKEILKDENLLEQFVVGSIVSGIAQGGDLVKSYKSGRDFVSGLSKNEQAVVDKVFEERLAEESKTRNISNAEKNKLYDQVVEEMKTGRIDTDTLERILGGETYEGYKNLTEQETSLTGRKKAIEDEIKSLVKTPEQQFTVEQRETLNSLREEAKGIKAQIKGLDTKTAKSNLFNEVNKLTANDTLLRESYNQREKRGQAFTADLNKYKGKQREAVKRAIDSGVLNDTYRSHELVDVLSRLEAEKGIVFDYTNNKKLAQSGMALNGKTVNGFEKNGVVTLNVQSSKAWQSTVGHEITHVLEGTESYSALQQALVEYAKSKGDYQGRYDSLVELYKGVKGYETDFEAKIQKELTADLVGDYLFSDKAFIDRLVGNRTLFQKVWDEVKYLCKVATGKELTEIEKVNREFERAWKELSANENLDTEATDAEVDDVQYSVSVTDKQTLGLLNDQIAKGEYDAETNPDGGYYVTYKSMSFWGYDEDGNAILRSPMAEYVDGELSNAYLIPKDKSKLNWYQATETIDENTGLPSGLLVKTKQEGKKSFSYLPAAENQDLIAEDWSNLYFNLRKKIQKNGKWVNSDVPARYNPYEHSSNSMLNDQFTAAYQRDNLVTVKMYVPISEDNGAYRAQWSKDPTGWSDWKSGIVAGKIAKQKDLQRRVYLSRYAAPVEIVPDSDVAQAYKSYLEGTDVAIPDNVVSPNLLSELKKAGVPIEESGKVKYSISDSNGNELSLAVQKRFANSKAVDENGKLKVLYHGTASGEFFTFDKSKGSVEGDFGSGFYFTDNESDVESNYEGGGPDFENKVARRAEQIEFEEDIDYHEAEARAREELYKGGFKHSVYLNIENPAIVGKTNLFDYDSYASEYDPNDYDSEEDYQADVEQLISDDIDRILWDVERYVDVENTDSLANELWYAVNDGGIGIEQLKAKINNLYLEDSNGNLVGNEVTRQIIESLGYDGIIDSTVSSKFNMGLDEGTTHYVVFKPNQIKDISNQNPTDNPDIRYSLSEGSPIINTLTNEEISDQTYDVLGRLERGENVPLSELAALKEVREGIQQRDSLTKRFVANHPELKNVPFEEVGTHLIHTEERERVREAILEKRLKEGSFTGIDKNGKEVYNGSVEKGKRLDIVIGIPAAGKSSAIVNPISQYYKSVVIDSDIIKGELPEYNGGWGASLVHEESSNINAKLFDRVTQTGNNIVLPIVGSKASGVEDYLLLAKAQGYDVYLHLNELPGGKAMGRVLRRYFQDGRFIEPAIAGKYGNKPTEVYEEMKARGDLSGYSRWNNDVARGQRPVFRDGSEGLEAYREFSDAWRASRTPDTVVGIGQSSQGTDAYLGDGVGGSQGFVGAVSPRGENSEGSIGLPKFVRLSPKTQEALSQSGVVSLELIDSSGDSNAFSHALSEARTSDEKNGWAVTPKSAEELVEYNVRTIMTSDGKAGLGVAPDGDIEAVFKNQNGGQSGVLKTLIPAALEMGGNKLDCYGEGLVKLYSRYGFVPVARLTFNPEYANDGWTPDKGTPDIFFMVHNGDSADTVAANIGKYKKWTTEELNALPLFDKDAYDDAYAYRDSFLPEDIAPMPDDQYSLSNKGGKFTPTGNYSTPMKEVALEQDIAPFVTDTNVGNKTADNTVGDVAPATEAPSPDEISPMTEEEANAIQDAKAKADAKEEGLPKSRKQLHNNIINDIKAVFSVVGYEFDDVLSKAKDLSTFSTVDNTPQRVMEKALGYKEGQVLADLTVNKVAQNETNGIKWLNSYTDRKNGLLSQISKQYNIKPGSKESAAAQMYAEGFFVNDNNDIVAYGDAELAQDFPDVGTQYRIKGLASDPRIRRIYDETLDAINKSRARNAYPEIQKLDNYFLHFRAMDDTFSKLGLPFNPNDIRAKDLPTDLNGVTADLKPGQPYFASAMHRTGKRTSFDLLGGLERYLTSAKNQIYHIDDIQTLRALRNYIADTYGQANGLEGIDALSEEEAQDRIEKVYNSHLSTFAKFLNEEANVLAGKTALIDRGLEGIIGRRGMTFLDTVNRQVGSNMVGFNISSSLTNFIPVAQTFAKTNKFDFLKAFTQTVSNKFGSIVGKSDGFAENSPVIIRRKGADRFYRTPFQKVGDAGYVLMSAVDNISTELIARTKFNELTRKGMDEQTAHFETDKWVSRLMGDRSLGQQPQMYNSKTLGVLTKFQLEVRNQLDSQFYDTIQEAKVSNDDIENALARNAKTAAKVTSTFVQLAVAQHLFGKAFESVAGYNPAFDIISTLATMFGLDDDEESEDTALDNIEQGFLELLEDLPYTSTFTGGRIPISSALPITELIKGVDSYGNEKSRLETLGEALPYYVLPGGYGQIKKTYQGLNMFSDDHPVSGSYTASGKLRFPVEDTPLNRLQAGLFGQYASENAREYFDEGYAPLKEKQIQEYIDVDIPIKDYWEYREGLNDLAPLPGKSSVTLEQKVDYINSLDLPVSKKNILVNNITDRKDPIDMTDYGDYSSLEEFDFATKYPDKYAVAKSVGGYSSYKTYASALSDIKADKDANGKTISGSRKEKVLQYINGLDADYETKIILFKSEYPSDDTYNMVIIDYVNNRADLTYEERVSILKELGFTVNGDTVYWD